MGRIKKRNDGRYEKTFTFNGKRYHVYGSSQMDVERKTVDKMSELEQNKVEHDNPTMQLYYEHWSENRKGSVKESTLRVQDHFFNTIAKITINGVRFADYRIADVKADDIRYIQRDLLEDYNEGKKGNSERTVNDKIALLSHMFRDAVIEEYRDKNPCTPVKPLKITKKEQARDTIHRALDREEQKLFFEAAKDSYYYNIFRFAVLTGMRIGEIGGLYLSDIYDGMIHVNRTVTRTATGSYTIGDDTKTPHGKRTIPLNSAINDVLNAQKALNRCLDGDKVTAIHNTVFKAYDRGILLPFALDREIGRICKCIGIERFTLHAFRATFATRCIENGVAPRTLQELLGHADFGLTMNLYGHVVDDTKVMAMQKMNIAL